MALTQQSVLTNDSNDNAKQSSSTPSTSRGGGGEAAKGRETEAIWSPMSHFKSLFQPRGFAAAEGVRALLCFWMIAFRMNIVPSLSTYQRNEITTDLLLNRFMDLYALFC
jgi:hypothetical protein